MRTGEIEADFGAHLHVEQIMARDGVRG